MAAGGARDRVPAFGQGPDQGTADGGVVFHYKQLCHTSDGSDTVSFPQVDPVWATRSRSGRQGLKPALYLLLRQPVPATLGRCRCASWPGVGAWLFGAGTATAGSLLAVSLLGQGIAASPSQQLTGAAVNRALARESRGPGQDVPSATPSPVHTSERPGLRDPHHGAEPSGVSPASSNATAAPSAATSPGPRAAAGTVLTSPGGTVLAECLAAGTYLERMESHPGRRDVGRDQGACRHGPGGLRIRREVGDDDAAS